MSTHNICFCGEIRKIFSLYPILSRSLKIRFNITLSVLIMGVFRKYFLLFLHDNKFYVLFMKLHM